MVGSGMFPISTLLLMNQIRAQHRPRTTPLPAVSSPISPLVTTHGPQAKEEVVPAGEEFTIKIPIAQDEIGPLARGLSTNIGNLEKELAQLKSALELVRKACTHKAVGGKVAVGNRCDICGQAWAGGGRD